MKNLNAAKSWGLNGELKIQGVSDLTWNGRKFSGNAMRRGKNFFFLHGTFLYQFDIQKISDYLGKPDREPDYRSKRSHADFLTNIPIQKQRIIESLQKEWSAKETLHELPNIEKLMSEVYSQASWNLKY